jgi:hypothetical protein
VVAAKRRNAVEDGRWIEAEAAQREWARELMRIVADMENFCCVTLARALADDFGADWKIVSTKIRTLYREHRIAVADRAAAELEKIDSEKAHADRHGCVV